MPTCTMVVLRHGETVWNVERRVQGHQNSDLTERGRKEVELLGRRFAGWKFAALYCSDLRRAVESLRPMAQVVGAEPQLEQRLRERNLGVLEGMTAGESERAHPAVWRGFKSNDPDFAIPGGESPRQLHQRVRGIISEIGERHLDQQVAVMGHAGVLNHVFRICAGLPLTAPRTFSTLNASVNVVEYSDGHFRLRTWGDTSHLEPLAVEDGRSEQVP